MIQLLAIIFIISVAVYWFNESQKPKPPQSLEERRQQQKKWDEYLVELERNHKSKLARKDRWGF